MKISTDTFLPPAARGVLFEKTTPLDPPQKLLIKGGHRLQPERTFVQTLTAFGLFMIRLKRRLKASIPHMRTNSNRLYNIQHFAPFSAGSVQLKESSVGPKGLIGPPCHGVILILFLAAPFLYGHGVKVTAEKKYPVVMVKAQYHRSQALVNASVTIRFQEDKKEFQKGNTDQNGIFCFCPDKAGQWMVIVDDLVGHRGKKTITITGAFFNISSPPPKEKSEAVPVPVETKASPSTGNELCCYLLKIVLGALLILIITYIFYRLRKRRESAPRTSGNWQ